MHNKHQVIEEPCEAKASRTVLETSGSREGLAEFNSFYTDSNGHHEPNPKFLRTAESDIKHAQRRIYKKEKGSNNRRKARKRYSKKHLRVNRQRTEHAKRLARHVCKSNDLVAYEDLRIRNMVKCHNRAKSISDASWYQFRLWLEHFAKKFGKKAIAVPPHNTSQECCICSNKVKKELKERTHSCTCGLKIHRDINAAINILLKARIELSVRLSFDRLNCRAHAEVRNAKSERLSGSTELRRTSCRNLGMGSPEVTL